ncbi:hypothetical protein Tco_1274082 [Tanacetum coccineum]
MVACLEKSEGNADFHEIVDFLTASSVHYALTQIHATVDGKTVVISESSVRSDLHFNDEDGITCLTNDAIFENLALMGYESDSNKLTFQKYLFSPQWKYLIHTILHCLSSKSTSWNEFSTNIASAVICLANGQKFNFSKLIFDGKVTPLFASMLAPPVVEGEGSGQPSEPQPAPSTAQPIIKEQIPVTESSSPQNTQSPRQALQEDTQLPQTSMPIPNVADEVVFKEWDDRVVRATTTAASLDAAQASGNITKTQSIAMSNDPLSQEISSGDRPKCQEAMGVSLLRLGGHTPGVDEGRPNINELMAICINLSNMVLALEQSKTAQDLVIQKLKKKVKRLEKKQRARTPGMKLFKIGTSKRKSLDKDAAGPLNVSTVDFSTSTAGDIFKDEMMTIADTLVAIRSTRPRTTSILIHDVKEEPRRATPVPIIQRDKELAIRLHEEDKAELERMQSERATTIR